MFPTIFELSSIFFNEQECLKFLFDKGILYKDRLAGDTRNQIMKKTGHSENTVTDYLNVFRDLVAGYVSDCD